MRGDTGDTLTMKGKPESLFMMASQKTSVLLSLIVRRIGQYFVSVALSPLEYFKSYCTDLQPALSLGNTLRMF
jgi:hypothetical protein